MILNYPILNGTGGIAANFEQFNSFTYVHLFFISTAESSMPKTKEVSATPAYQSQIIIGSVVGAVFLLLLAGVLVLVYR